MRFLNESAFREWLCERLKTMLPTQWMVLKGKNVADIILSRQNADCPLLAFLEVKYHKINHGRISIGSGSGRGYQPEYLLRRIEYLERNLRWIVADEALEKCLILTNDEVRTSAVGGIGEGKHNNLKTTIFHTKKSDLFGIDDTPLRIMQWINQL